MIRVVIEVDTYGHQFSIERSAPVCQGDFSAVHTIDELLRSAQASMNAALTAKPQPQHYEIG